MIDILPAIATFQRIESAMVDGWAIAVLPYDGNGYHVLFCKNKITVSGKAHVSIVTAFNDALGKIDKLEEKK